jgi:hypothetical protein
MADEKTGKMILFLPSGGIRSIPGLRFLHPVPPINDVNFCEVLSGPSRRNEKRYIKSDLE